MPPTRGRHRRTARPLIPTIGQAFQRLSCLAVAARSEALTKNFRSTPRTDQRHLQFRCPSRRREALSCRTSCSATTQAAATVLSDLAGTSARLSSSARPTNCCRDIETQRRATYSCCPARRTSCRRWSTMAPAIGRWTNSRRRPESKSSAIARASSPDLPASKRSRRRELLESYDRGQSGHHLWAQHGSAHRRSCQTRSHFPLVARAVLRRQRQLPRIRVRAGGLQECPESTAREKSDQSHRALHQYIPEADKIRQQDALLSRS